MAWVGASLSQISGEQGRFIIFPADTASSSRKHWSVPWHAGRRSTANIEGISIRGKGWDTYPTNEI